jgi:hypothetical protein
VAFVATKVVKSLAPNADQTVKAESEEAESSGLKDGYATLLAGGGVAAAVFDAVKRISANNDTEGVSGAPEKGPTAMFLLPVSLGRRVGNKAGPDSVVLTCC